MLDCRSIDKEIVDFWLFICHHGRLEQQLRDRVQEDSGLSWGNVGDEGDSGLLDNVADDSEL